MCQLTPKPFVQLMRAFEFEFVNPNRPWVEHSYITPHHTDMWVKFTEAVLR